MSKATTIAGTTVTTTSRKPNHQGVPTGFGFALRFCRDQGLLFFVRFCGWISCRQRFFERNGIF